MTVTRTKILIPRRREDLLSRSRLLRILDDILDYPFTLISAPAGYGKTSLLIDFAHQAEYPVCWYSLDKMDQDPRRFLDHLIGCVQIHFPGFGETSLQLVRDLPNPFDQTDLLIDTLVNELYEEITEQIGIILDDYHLVAENPKINSFISKFGQRADDNIHLVMTSRNQFDFPDISLLSGRRQIKGIDFDDLSFTEEEIKTLFLDIYKQTLTTEQIKGLAAETEGWITGLLLTGRHIREYIPEQEKAVLVTGTDIFKYLAKQVFKDQSGEIREFLLQTSIFDEFSQKLCKEVLGWPEENNWDEIIQYLIKQNLFVQQINDQQTWIRYHNLFLDYLRVNFKKSQPEQEKILLSRLIDAYAQLSEWEKAYEAAQRLGDEKRLAQVIDLASSDLFHSGRIQLLARWLDNISKNIFETIPRIEALYGFTKTELGFPKDGIAFLSRSASNHKTKLSPLDHAQTLNWKASACRMLGNYEEALINAQSAYDLALNANMSTIQYSESLREIGLAYFRLGNLGESIKYLKSSLISYDSINNEKNIALVHMDLGSLYINQGILHEATIHYQLAYGIWSDLGNVHKLSNLLNNLGYLSLLTGDYINANSRLKEGLRYSKEIPNIRMQGLLNASIGDLAKDIEHYQVAIEKYKNSLYLSEKCSDRYLQIYLTLSIASIYRILNNLHLANNYLSIYRKEIENNKSKAALGLWHFEMGMLNSKAGNIIRGRKSFHKANNVLKKFNKPLEMANLLAGRALLEIRSGKSAAAVKYLQAASVTIKGIGSNQPLLPILSRHFDDFKQILFEISDPDLVQLKTDLLDFRERLPGLRREIFPDQKSLPTTKKGLKIQAFGKTRIWVDGKKITVSEWVHQKTVRELFFYLLTRSESVSKEQVGLIFWPDSSPTQLTGQFKNAIYRLRRAIGKEWILYDPDTRCYAFNSNLDHSYDVKEFLALAETAQQESDPESRLVKLQQAIKLYQHPFAADLDGVWVEPIRRNLYLRYEKLALESAETLLGFGRYNECLKVCENIIYIEPCQEKAYQISFHSYHKKEDYTGLTRSYNFCIKNLSHFLGIGPSEKTNNLYRSYSIVNNE